MKNFNNNQKLFLIGILSIVFMFLIYNLFLSPYARCVSGMINEYDVSKDFAKVRCTTLHGGGD